MRLPQINLDDRGFQDLVNEARLRIAQTCPEWTEHNVSDPGITLIELFAWMTEMVIYRLNRLPDKLHVALMELLAIKLEPPTAARADVRFRLAGPVAEAVEVPEGTEVGTLRTPSEESIVFQTMRHFTIPHARPTAYGVEKGRAVRDVGVADGVARPKGPDQLPFSSPPVVGEALYLGFDHSLSRMLMQVDVDCSQARGAGVDPEDPPLRWEVSSPAGPGGWAECQVLVDRTGGFNYGSGIVELQLPADHEQATVGGRRAYWLRCRLDDRTRSGAQAATFSHPPEIYSMTAAPVGALIPAAHSSTVVGEALGESDGTPSQSFRLNHAPVLPLEEGEHLEVVAAEGGGWQRWERRESFADSGPEDLHYTLDLASGELELGPAIRTGDGGWRQYGAVPPKGAHLRVTRYRHGGGRRGNVAPGALNVLKSAIPYVASVVNPDAAVGGVDPESLESARQRASMEIRTRYRAVTAQDFEFLCGEASPRVARAICLEPPDSVGVARIHVVPRIQPADRPLSFAELLPDQQLMADVAAYLDERRLVGTRVELLPARYRGVSVVVNLQASLASDPRRVEEDVTQALYTYLNPVVGGALEGVGSGWAFGRALNQGELYGVIHAVDGVDFVKILRIYETNLQTGEQEPKPLGSHLAIEADELIASGRHIVKAEHREY
ncbi:MAG: putative baseplate assembly protein [Actinomycetota bacterium]